MGDSLTDPRSHGGKYLDVLRKRCPESQFESRAKGGEMVNQMRRRFARDVLDGPAAAGEPPYTDVIVFGGVNDLYSDLTAGRTPEKVEADLEEMYRSARTRGLRVVAITVAPWGGFRRYFNESRGKATERVNAWIREQPRAGTVDVVVDAYALLSCDGGTALCPEFSRPFNDGIHFGPAGHERLGQALFDAAFQDCR
jgi:lysophospholipase L1-like esterase